MKNKKIFILLNNYIKLSLPTMYGVYLAKELKTPAILLAIEKINTVTLIGGSMPTYPMYQDFKALKRRAMLHLRKLCLDIRHVWREIDCDVAIGFSNQKVISIMDEKDPLLLVIEGRSDLTTLNEWFGTYETKIAERADCPVLIVQPQTVWKP
ncbi:MAG: hypothetical protein ACI9XB_004366, partial [Gammaproteobacteria bacterium]